MSTQNNVQSSATVADALLYQNVDAVRNIYLSGKFEEALIFIRSLPHGHSKDGQILLIAGACFFRLSKLAEAESLFIEASLVAPCSSLPHYNLGMVYEQRSQFEATEQHFKAAFEIDADHVPTLLGLARVLRQLRRLDEAEQFARRAVSIEPSNDSALSLVGVVLWEQGRTEQAELFVRRALELNPGKSTCAMQLAELLLSMNNWSEGLRLYERRHADDLKERCGVPPLVSFPPWRGESLRGKSLLVWPEQGFGDQIQLARYVRKLRGRGAVKITLVCVTALQPLFASIHGVDAAITPEMYDAFGAPVHDFWVFAFSIPFNLRETPATVHAPIPYLRATKKRIAHWQSMLRTSARKIGLAWRGNAMNRRDPTRSLPSLAVLEPLLNVAGPRFVSLQWEPTEGELQAFAATDRIMLPGDKIANFADLAAVIMNLDLVITVDTAVAHLAGALGKPTWILLPNVARDWRWGLEGSDSVWYPGVVRLFRQAVSERDWTPVIERVADALSTFESSSASEKRTSL